MKDRHIEDMDMPAEIDFGKGIRGLHHIPSGARVLMPASIERSVWEYFSEKAVVGPLVLWGGQSWPQPPFRRPEPAESRLRAKLPAPRYFGGCGSLGLSSGDCSASNLITASAENLR